MEQIVKKRKVKVRGTGCFDLNDNSFEFTAFNEAPSTQQNVKTCTGGGKRWTTTGSDPSKMITLKSKESSPDQYADFAKQFEALTRDLKPKKPVVLPDTQRVIDEDGLQCWLNEAKGELTFTGTISLTKNCRNWQAEVLRQVQLIVRRLPASEKFNKVISNIKNGETK
jgi:hypothetical protein